MCAAGTLSLLLAGRTMAAMRPTTTSRRRYAALATSAALALGTALLTQIVYPLTYGELLVASAFPTVVLTLRNLALAVLFVWAFVRVARTRTRPRVKRRAAASASASPKAAET